jgi:hypothetical protein
MRQLAANRDFSSRGGIIALAFAAFKQDRAF